MPDRTISTNRAPILTLWAAVVAERLGFGKALAGLTAQSKGRRRGIYKPHEEGAKHGRVPPAQRWRNWQGRTRRRSLPSNATRFTNASGPPSPPGVKGWGAKGELDLGLIERLAKKQVT
jgi:hypothetical protein